MSRLEVGSGRACARHPGRDRASPSTPTARNGSFPARCCTPATGSWSCAPPAATRAGGSSRSTASPTAPRPRRSRARCLTADPLGALPDDELWLHELVGAEVATRARHVARHRCRGRRQPGPRHPRARRRRARAGGVPRRARATASSSSTRPKDCSTSTGATDVRIDVFSIFPEYLDGPLRRVAARPGARGGHPRRAGPRPPRPHHRPPPQRRRRTVRRRRGDGHAARAALRRDRSRRAAAARAAPERAGPPVRPAGWPASSRPVTGSRSCAAATKVSTSASPTTPATASSRWPTSCSPEARRPRSWWSRPSPRLVPGVMGNDASADDESFGPDGLLEYPQYTRPADYRGWDVPEPLRSGRPRPDRPLAPGPVAAPDARPPARPARRSGPHPDDRDACSPSSDSTGPAA